MARVKANLRKAEVQVQNSANAEKPKKENVVIELGDLILDTERFEVKVRGKVIDLTLREFEVLKYLASQPGQVITREVLLEKVWGYEYYGDIRTVDVEAGIPDAFEGMDIGPNTIDLFKKYI